MNNNKRDEIATKRIKLASVVESHKRAHKEVRKAADSASSILGSTHIQGSPASTMKDQANTNQSLHEFCQDKIGSALSPILMDTLHFTTAMEESKNNESVEPKVSNEQSKDPENGNELAMPSSVDREGN